MDIIKPGLPHMVPAAGLPTQPPVDNGHDDHASITPFDEIDIPKKRTKLRLYTILVVLYVMSTLHLSNIITRLTSFDSSLLE